MEEENRIMELEEHLAHDEIYNLCEASLLEAIFSNERGFQMRSLQTIAAYLCVHLGRLN